MTDSVLNNLSKAFDTLLHGAIYKKLVEYGLEDGCLDCCKSYLSDGRPKVRCNIIDVKSVSDTYPVHYGTLQGSCLGPLIILIFVNDLGLHLSSVNCI